MAGPGAHAYVGDKVDKRGADKRGSATVEQAYDYRDFERINISGIYEVNVRVRNGSDYMIRLSGREAALARALVRVENNTLYLGHKKRDFNTKKRRSGSRGKKMLTAIISLPRLHGINISGVVEGRISGIDVDKFNVEVSGVGDLRLAGKCNSLIAELSGVGDLNARALVCRSADVSVSGVGDAQVYASESLKARVSGIGDLTCYGSPKRVRKNRSFFSSIRVH